MSALVNLYILLLFWMGVKALTRDYTFIKVALIDIPLSSLNATSVDIATSSESLCGIYCVHSTSCAYFLFNTTSRSCILLGSEGTQKALDVAEYSTWETFALQAACPSSMQYIEQFDKCIQINTNIELSWVDSQAACENNGGSLMNINSDDEFAYFLQLFATLLQEPYFFHLGAKKTGSALDEFHWVYGDHIGEKVKSSYWVHGKPDNQGGDEFCVASRAESDFYLEDVGCSPYDGFFICEYLMYNVTPSNNLLG